MKLFRICHLFKNWIALLINKLKRRSGMLGFVSFLGILWIFLIIKKNDNNLLNREVQLPEINGNQSKNLQLIDVNTEYPSTNQTILSTKPVTAELTKTEHSSINQTTRELRKTEYSSTNQTTRELTKKEHSSTNQTTRELKKTEHSSINQTTTELRKTEQSDNKIINPHNFRYMLVNNETCHIFSTGKQNELFLFVFILSSPAHFKHRSLIRSTWGSFSYFKQVQMIAVFVLGKPSAESLQPMLNLEYERYQDIIQEDFMDTYRNLTYKVIAGLKWITNHCQEATFILKADDDMLVNVFNLKRYLNFFLKYSLNPSAIMGKVYFSPTPKRDNSSKWFVSTEDYPYDLYPDYCSGAAYIIPRLTLPRLYNASLHIKSFWLEDIFITGMLAKLLNIPRVDLTPFFAINKIYYRKLIRGEGIFFHMPTNTDVDKRYEYWKRIY